MADDFYGDEQGQDNLQQEWKARQAQFRTLGYRDSVALGKDETLQQGFNAGFKESVQAGFDWGRARGVTSALTTLGPKANLLLTPEAQAELVRTHADVAAVSSSEALQMFSATLLGHPASQGADTSEVSQVAANEGDSPPGEDRDAGSTGNDPLSSSRLEDKEKDSRTVQVEGTVRTRQSPQSDRGRPSRMRTLESRVSSLVSWTRT